MRINGKRCRVWAPRLALAALLAAVGVPSHAQQDYLTPGQSAAKAKKMIQETIAALGGQAYLNVRDQSCQGRVAFFGHHGDLDNYEQIWDFNLYPDKERTEYSKKRNIIDLYNGTQGWTLDRGGVSPMPASAITDFQNGLKKDINILFRFDLKDPNLQFSYGGRDIVDLKEADWIEVTGGERWTTRIAIARLTHLPIEAQYISRDPETRERSTETEIFSNYQPVDGVEMPFQDVRSRNGDKIFQLWLTHCDLNTGLQPDFFTRESLEERWQKLGGNSKKKSE